MLRTGRRADLRLRRAVGVGRPLAARRPARARGAPRGAPPGAHAARLGGLRLARRRPVDHRRTSSARRELRDDGGRRARPPSCCRSARSSARSATPRARRRRGVGPRRGGRRPTATSSPRFGRLRPKTPEAVFRAQTLLVHEWRKFPFLDPDLPEEHAAGAAGRAQRAHDVFHERHAAWHEAAQDYFGSLEERHARRPRLIVEVVAHRLEVRAARAGSATAR